MTLKPLNRTFLPTTRNLNYLNKSFNQWRQSLIDYAKQYFPNSYNDFNESSPGLMFIEMASYVGDVLGYYLDYQFKENLLLYAEEQQNIIAMAQAFGYKPKPTTAATTTCDFYQLCPAGDATINFAPDERYFLKLDANMVVSAPDFGVEFITNGLVDFADPADRDISVYAVNNANQPLTYLVRKSGNVVAGTIKTFSVSFGAPLKFSTITLPENNVLEIISVKDSNGFTWYQVDYLAQDVVYVDIPNTFPTIVANQSLSPSFFIQLQRNPRRFVTRYTDTFLLQLQFGSGIIDDTSPLINLEPTKIASDEYQTNIGSSPLDPADFLGSNSYGLAPTNIVMNIQYTVGGGLQSNVPVNSINKITTVSVLNDKTQFLTSELGLFNDVVSSLAVNNSAPAIGGKDADSVEEIRQNALGFFNSQNRLVNAQDYAVRCYAMPGKYGAIAKAYVVQDQQINNIIRATTMPPVSGSFVGDNPGQNAVNIYVLGYDQNKNLVNLNDDVKENLRTYLSSYKILTDELRIMDAFVVTIGVNFNIVAYKNFNLNEVLARCINSIETFFDVDAWQIGQPIILSDIYSTLGNVEGVQSVVTVDIVNKYNFRDGPGYSPYIYDIAGATLNGVIYCSLDPSIFSIAFPSTDIVGNGMQ